MTLLESLKRFEPSKLSLAREYLTTELQKLREKESAEQSLTQFVREAWPYIDSSEYLSCWAIDALCDHLQGVTCGHIQKLLVNYPPRCAKTNVVSISFPAWTWARREKSFWSGAGVRFLCGSYGGTLSMQNSNKCRRLITSPWYQERWGKGVVLRDDQNTKTQFDLAAGGQRIATSVGGSLLGIGGDIILIDDPHNTSEVESEADRSTAIDWWREIRSTRLNDPKKSALIVVMQRLHQEDVSGNITHGEDADEWVHLMLPMRHDENRHCTTTWRGKDWEDPRHGRELMWPERFGEKQVAALERDLGPYMASGRLQQEPTPSGGGIIKSDYWMLWEEENFPTFDYMLASADTAYTEKEENDPTGFTIWGVFRESKTDHPKVMLIWAWRKHLELHGVTVERLAGETDPKYFHRTNASWGLVEWIAYSCRKFKVDRLLVEAKASGISAAQELKRLHGNEGWSIDLVTPEGDKVARAHAVEPSFAQGIIYAPDREWAEMVIDECAAFPKGRYKDLTDSTTQALKYLREYGLISHAQEVEIVLTELRTFKSRPRPLYPV